MTIPLTIDYYSDVLCVWAWIAQRRVDELQAQWGERIRLNHRYLNLFGDTAERVGLKWADKGGYAGFGRHVVESAAPFDQAPVNPKVWADTQPKTSANAHLVLSAVELAESEEASVTLALAIRRAFFVDALDIGQLPVLYEVAAGAGYDEAGIRACIRDGSAMAALVRNNQLAQDAGISGSPSWVLDGGRQKLYGNVGYRVLSANVEGLLDKSGDDASWC